MLPGNLLSLSLALSAAAQEVWTTLPKGIQPGEPGHFCRRKQPEAGRPSVPLYLGKQGRGEEHCRRLECAPASLDKTQDTQHSCAPIPCSGQSIKPLSWGLLSTQVITVGRRTAAQIHRECDCLAVGYRSSLNAFRVLPCGGCCLTMCGPGGDRYRGDLQNHHTVVLTHPYP